MLSRVGRSKKNNEKNTACLLTGFQLIIISSYFCQFGVAIFISPTRELE